MLEAIVTIATALLMTRFWSKLRYGFFDAFCALAATVGAFVTPLVAQKLAPELVEFGVLALDAGGALLGCLVYDHFARA